MTPNSDDLSRLERFLTDTEGQTKEDALAELTARGVSAADFKSRVAEAVRKGYQQQVKFAAQAARQKALERGRLRFGDLVGKSFTDLKAVFERIRVGEFGPGCQQAALARCRNLQNANPSEAELRSWLEDISTMDEQ